MFEIASESWLATSPYFWASVVIVLTIFFNILFRAPSSLSRPNSLVKPYKSYPFPGLGPISLYSKRDTFLRSVFGNPEEWHKSAALHLKSSRFNLRSHILTITSDPSTDGSVFFNDRGLAFNEGYEVMFAGVPQLPRWLAPTPADDAGGGAKDFSSDLRKAISGARLSQYIPETIRSSLQAFKELPAQDGKIDCHQTIYPLIFQISMYLVGLAEHARDLQTVRSMEAPFWTFADNVGYMATHFPMVPVPSTLSKWKGAIQMSTEIRRTIQKRKQDGRREDDYPQMMLDRGASLKSIEEFIMGSMFAAIINTTGVASYALIFMCSNPEIRNRVRQEIESVFKAQAEQRGQDWSSLSLYEKMAQVPLEVWESTDLFPYYELVVKETLRILLIAVIFRRKLRTRAKHTHTDSVIHGESIQQDEFVGLWLAASHRNSNYYSNPLDFDPERFTRGEGKGDHHFIPWGAGNHVCLGMRFAKLETKIVHVAFLLSFPEFIAVDQNGTAYDQKTIPKPDQNSEHRRYPQNPVFLQYTHNLALEESLS